MKFLSMLARVIYKNKFLRGGIMKVLVDKLPNKPEECVFYKEEYERAPYSGDSYVIYCCSIDGRSCDCKACDKLKEA